MSIHSIRAYAVWGDGFGSTFVWPQACVDNRRERIIARMERFGMTADLSTLRVFRTRAEADAYEEELHAQA